MANIDELLDNELNNGKIVLTIDEPSRTIKYDGDLILGVEQDYQAERIYFESPRYINMGSRVDLFASNIRINIKYKNGYKETYVKECVDKGSLNWIGTTVPNTGTISSIYLNTNLTTNEVVDILSQLTYNSQGSYIIYSGTSLVLAARDLSMYIADNTVSGYQIVDEKTGDIYFDSSTYLDSTSTGWEPGISSVLALTGTASSTYNEETVGEQNDIINSLVSIKSFKYTVPEVFTFSWLLPKNVTAVKGIVEFSVCIENVVTDSEGVEKIQNEWHTTPFEGKVLEGIEVTESTPVIITDETSSMYLLKEKVDGLEETVNNYTPTVTQEQIDSIETAINELPATYLGISDKAVSAAEADHATEADHASKADNASNANSASEADDVNTSIAGVDLQNIFVMDDTYSFEGDRPTIKYAKADANGNVIHDTYATKTALDNITEKVEVVDDTRHFIYGVRSWDEDTGEPAVCTFVNKGILHKAFETVIDSTLIGPGSRLRLYFNSDQIDVYQGTRCFIELFLVPDETTVYETGYVLTGKGCTAYTSFGQPAIIIAEFVTPYRDSAQGKLDISIYPFADLPGTSLYSASTIHLTSIVVVK